jgi:hypothetical protein
MPFASSGHALQEGEARMLVASLFALLAANPRLHLVERAVLDKMLTELKLGVSQLAERRTALALGKLLAARVILSGQIIYAQSEKQISARLIETETGRIAGAISEDVGIAAPLAPVAAQLSEILQDKLSKAFPLRARISKIHHQKVVLNIGTAVGAAVGQEFKTLAPNTIRIKVSAVEKNACTAVILQGADKVREGMRVEAL